MDQIWQLAALLVASLLLLLLPVILDGLGVSDFTLQTTQIIGFSITLIALFANNYFQSLRQERSFKVERAKELQLHEMSLLAQIETWLKEMNTLLDELSSIRELSDVDPVGDKIIVSTELLQSVARDLIRLDSQWLPIFAKAADLAELGPESKSIDDLPQHQQDLLLGLYSLGSAVSDLRELIVTSNTIPAVEQYSIVLAKISRSLDQFRQELILDDMGRLTTR